MSLKLVLPFPKHKYADLMPRLEPTLYALHPALLRDGELLQHVTFHACYYLTRRP
jgi:hypothetical protein